MSVVVISGPDPQARTRWVDELLEVCKGSEHRTPDGGIQTMTTEMFRTHLLRDLPKPYPVFYDGGWVDVVLQDRTSGFPPLPWWYDIDARLGMVLRTNGIELCVLPSLPEGATQGIKDQFYRYKGWIDITQAKEVSAEPNLEDVEFVESWSNARRSENSDVAPLWFGSPDSRMVILHAGPREFLLDNPNIQRFLSEYPMFRFARLMATRDVHLSTSGSIHRNNYKKTISYLRHKTVLCLGEVATALAMQEQKTRVFSVRSLRNVYPGEWTQDERIALDFCSRLVEYIRKGGGSTKPQALSRYQASAIRRWERWRQEGSHPPRKCKCAKCNPIPAPNTSNVSHT